MRRQIRIQRAGLAVAMVCAAAAGTESHVAVSNALPQLDGGHLQVHVVEVTYGPGEQSRAHSHSCPVSGYVIEGAVRMRVKGGTEAVFKAGMAFYEAPNGVHLTSANASTTERARFVAFFVCDHEGPLSVPVGGK